MRAVSADHIMFDEAIATFRPSSQVKSVLPATSPNTMYAALFTDFEIVSPIDVGYFKILPTELVLLMGAYIALAAPISFEVDHEFPVGSGFAVAVSTIISFATARPAKAPRDSYHISTTLNRPRYASLAWTFPVLSAGPGAHDTRLASTTFTSYAESITAVTRLLLRLSFTDYVRLFRAMRMVQLAHQVVRDDFGLGYYLLVSAIEVAASHAIPRNLVAEKHPEEDKWKVAARENETIRALLAAYKAERGKTQYLRQRFTRFILQYCPPSSWNELEHPHENLSAYLAEIAPQQRHDSLTRRSRFEIYPADLPEDFVLEVIGNLYKYRSNYTHEGVAPPHRHPVSYNHFFDHEFEYDEGTGTMAQLILPNFRLVAFIAQRSILAYAAALSENRTDAEASGA
jgi:hypothetical protein